MFGLVKPMGIWSSMNFRHRIKPASQCTCLWKNVHIRANGRKWYLAWANSKSGPAISRDELFNTVVRKCRRNLRPWYIGLADSLAGGVHYLGRWFVVVFFRITIWLLVGPRGLMCARVGYSYKPVLLVIVLFCRCSFCQEHQSRTLIINKRQCNEDGPWCG